MAGVHTEQKTTNKQTQGLNYNFLYKGTLTAFDNSIKLIVMHRCIVRLKYGTTETGKFWFISCCTADKQPAAEVPTHRWKQKAPDFEILCNRDCRLWALKGTTVPSRCGCNFLTGTAFPLAPPPEFKYWTNLLPPGLQRHSSVILHEDQLRLSSVTTSFQRQPLQRHISQRFSTWSVDVTHLFPLSVTSNSPAVARTTRCRHQLVWQCLFF